ncbi:hypothetical protein DTO027B5_6260 [Paecilomyces variotii]|nr:hypothetical protein DTO027B3_6716 [Paecilomyces variotii]KAJ9331981.1 hypothetical protein DTO027B5_6260 [Paecilomyces variotii]
MTLVSVADFEALRATSAPLPQTVAPSTSSDHFKSPHVSRKPKSKQLSHHFSIESRNFKGSALKKAASMTSDKKIISLGTGRPTAEYYPWDLFVVDAKAPTALATERGQPAVSQTFAKSGDGYNLGLALNYGHGVGSPHLLRFVTEHVELIHNPPYSDWGVCLTAGSTSAMEIVFRIFCDRGDTILTEVYTYPGTVEGAALLSLRIQGVQMDAEGAKPDHLKRILDSWDHSQGPKPTVFYTIPSGQNPTGATQSLERRRQIYQIAEEHDLIIVEDDPYYFLRMGKRLIQSEKYDDEKAIPSYVSLDHSGRVVRLDSTSKILSPGLRVGWVIAKAEIIDKFLAYQEVSTVAVSGPAQLMLWKLLDDYWGHEGFSCWLESLSSRYRSRRDIILEACDRYLPKEVCDWVEPEYGMFLWINVNWIKHPRFQDQAKHQDVELQIIEIENRIVSTALQNGVQVLKGSLFHCNKKPVAELHCRMTFAAADEEDLEDGVRLFADAVKAEFKLEC